MGTHKKDEEEARIIFRDEIWNKISYIIGEGRLLTTERNTTEVEKHMDIFCAIDGLQILQNNTAIPLAIRTQWDYNWAGFTVRKSRPDQGLDECEFTKICNAIDNGGMHPKYHIHSYYDREGKEIIAVGIVDTVALINYIRYGKKRDYDIKTTYQDGQKTDFYCVKWADLKKKGIEVKLYNYEIPEEEEDF